MSSLLAIDVGVRTGMALYGSTGKLAWYRSQNFGSAERLKRAIPSLLNGIQDLRYLVLEGGGHLARPWFREADRAGIAHLLIHAEEWRRELLYQREQVTGKTAKLTSAVMARNIIIWSGLDRPVSLRHDAAEAILVGLWGVRHVGWLDTVPPEARHPAGRP